MQYITENNNTLLLLEMQYIIEIILIILNGKNTHPQLMQNGHSFLYFYVLQRILYDLLYYNKIVISLFHSLYLDNLPNPIPKVFRNCETSYILAAISN